MSAEREALVDAFIVSLRALLLAGPADGRAPPATACSGQTLRAKDVAERYGVAVETVYGWVNSSMLPGLRLPGRNDAGSYRFRDSDLAEFDRRRECNWTPPEPVVLTPGGQVVPIAARSSSAFQRGRRAGRA